MYAEIIINTNARALNKIFDYIVPNSMEKTIKIGARVCVPFGNGKKLEDGFVISLKEESEFANKEIIKIIEEECLTEENIVLAKLMARKYFCNISECIKLMLPPGTGGKILENRAKEKTGNFVFLKKEEQEILEQIENGTATNDADGKVTFEQINYTEADGTVVPTFADIYTFEDLLKKMINRSF